MMKAEIKDGIVTNIITIDPDNIPDWCANWPDATKGCQIGGSYVDGVFTPLPVPEEEPPTFEQQQAARETAYKAEADPLFFMAQRGKATQQEWLDKIAEIETRFPYPEV